MSDTSIERALKADRTDGKPWGEIKATIERNAVRQQRRKAAASGSSAETRSLKDQIAEWQARLAEATPGSEEWAEAHDTLQRLRQMPQDSDT